MTESIQFFSEDITFDLENKSTIRNWISEIIKSHNFVLESINYIFCSDRYLLSINLDRLAHDTLTDIITFNNADSADIICTDIFISIERVKENASLYSTSFEEELHRVMVHGILHLLGMEDGNIEEKQLMREKEEACLSLLRKCK